MRLTVGLAVDSFTLVPISSNEVMNSVNNTVVIMLNRETNDRLMDFYKGVKAILKGSNNKLLVLLGDKGNESNIAQQIINLCLMYNCYNIYKEVPGINFTKEYVEELLNREPSRDEVELYISRSQVAVESLDEMLLDLDRLAEAKDMDELAEYVAKNKSLIEQFPEIFNELKELADPATKLRESDFKDLQKELKTLKKEYDNALSQNKRAVEQLQDREVVIGQIQKTLQEQEQKAKKNESLYKDSAMKIKELTTDNQRLKDQLKKGDTLEFNFLQTTRLNTLPSCKAKGILYFKELSRPKYFNSFITYLAQYLVKATAGRTKENVKIIIYDKNKDFAELYMNEGVGIYTSESYFTLKTDAVAKSTVVFLDLNPSYISDMLSEGSYEYYIIVDRLGLKPDIVEGPSVAKFMVMSSARECTNYTKKNGPTLNPIITSNSTETQKLKNVLMLMEQPSYPTTEQGAFAKWAKMANTIDGTVFDIVLSKIGVRGKGGKGVR